VERPRRVVRFARLIRRPGRVLGGPAVRAAFGDNPSLTWLPLNVLALKHTAPWIWDSSSSASRPAA